MEFDWDEANIEHIARHGVEPEEAEEAVLDDDRVQARAYSTPTERRYAFIGMTGSGRMLLVSFTVRRGALRVVTAHPATEGQRRQYRRARRR